MYSRCSPCFANRFFAVHDLQDLRRSNSVFGEHKGVFRQKKKEIHPLVLYFCRVHHDQLIRPVSVFRVANMFAQKLTVNNVQYIVTRSPCFREQYFVHRKKGFRSLFNLFANSVQQA